MLPRQISRYIVTTGAGVRPNLVGFDGQVLRWVCPVYVEQRGAKFNSHFIADVIAETPIDAAARAAALGRLIVRALERQTDASLGGALHGDAYSFAELFGIPHNAFAR